MEYTGENKSVLELMPGDFVSLSGSAIDAAEVEDIRPIGDKIVILLASGAAKALDPDKTLRLYA